MAVIRIVRMCVIVRVVVTVIMTMVVTRLVHVEQFWIDRFDRYLRTWRERLAEGSFHQSALTGDWNQEVAATKREFPVLIAYMLTQFERLLPTYLRHGDDQRLPAFELDDHHSLVVFDEHVSRRELLLTEDDPELGSVREFCFESRAVSLTLAYDYGFEGPSPLVASSEIALLRDVTEDLAGDDHGRTSGSAVPRHAVRVAAHASRITPVTGARRSPSTRTITPRSSGACVTPA